MALKSRLAFSIIRSLLYGFLSLLAASSLSAAQDTAAQQTRPDLYGQRIVIDLDGARPTSALRQAVTDLKTTLATMTASDFVEVQDGDGIILTLATSPKVSPAFRARLDGRPGDAFLLVGDDRRLTIIATAQTGLVNGLYRYLQNLGVRWLMAGPNWTVIPPRQNIALTVDQLYEPVFRARQMACSGGFSTRFFGDQWNRAEAALNFSAASNLWKTRLGFGGSMVLPGSVGERFLVSHATPWPEPDPARPGNHTLQDNPDYLAMVSGKPTPLYVPRRNDGRETYRYDAMSKRYVLAAAGTGDHSLNLNAKINVANSAAVNLFVNWALTQWRSAPAGMPASNPPVISAETSDGPGFATDAAGLPGDGSPSDQAFHLANVLAAAAAREIPGSLVSLYAYGAHADPPSFALAPNVLVQVVASHFRKNTRTADLTANDFLRLWAAKAPHLAIRDYWALPAWNHEQPGFDPAALPGQFRSWQDLGVVGINMESSCGGGAMGLGAHVASQLLWTPHAKVESIVADWHEAAFGPAYPPMRRMFARWAKGFKPTDAEFQASYSDLQAAIATPDLSPGVRARLDDMALYIHFLRRHSHFASEKNPRVKARRAAHLIDDLVAMTGTGMVHTMPMINLVARRAPGVNLAWRELCAARHKSTTARNGDPRFENSDCARSVPPDHDSIMRLIAADAKSHGGSQRLQ